MISEYSTKELQKKRIELQANLSSLIESKTCSKDDINELRAEILHIDKLIEKKVGSNELKRQEEVRRKKTRKDELIIKNFYGIKKKYKQISTMSVATTRLMNIVDTLTNTTEYTNERVKVRG